MQNLLSSNPSLYKSRHLKTSNDFKTKESNLLVSKSNQPNNNLKIINLAIIGHGKVGKALIQQIVQNQPQIQKNSHVLLRIFAVANSTSLLLAPHGIDANWEWEKSKLKQQSFDYKQIIRFASELQLDNLILVDNTANLSIAETYTDFIQNGFHVVSSNKIANTLSQNDYNSLRKTLANQNKKYYYETNVGAGLPLIDTLNKLQFSGEKIHQISGVFSGSLSFIFNELGRTNKPISQIIKKAVEKGYTEPDPRIDLSGQDVARKLLILARELGLSFELKDIKVQNLIPKHLQSLEPTDFLNQLNELDVFFENLNKELKSGNVYRYIGKLNLGNKTSPRNLEVKLVQVNAESSLFQTKGADNIFEIYTDSYSIQPLVIQGAGAGSQVTARGVLTDILKIASF